MPAIYVVFIVMTKKKMARDGSEIFHKTMAAYAAIVIHHSFLCCKLHADPAVAHADTLLWINGFDALTVAPAVAFAKGREASI